MPDGPGNVFVYDSLDKPNSNKKSDIDTKTSIRVDWKIVLALLPLWIFLFVCIIIIHTWAWNLYLDYEYRTIGILILAPLYLGFGALILGFVSIALKLLWNYVRRIELVNVMEHQTTVDKLRYSTDTATEYFSVMGRRADKSLFSSAQNITYSPHTSNSNQLPENKEQEIIPEPLQYPETSLEALEDKGLIGRSGNSLMVGFGEENTD